MIWGIGKMQHSVKWWKIYKRGEIWKELNTINLISLQKKSGVNTFEFHWKSSLIKHITIMIIMLDIRVPNRIRPEVE